MGLNDLQSHLTKNITNAVEPVDLVGKTVRTKNGNDRGDQFKLIIDGECCLDRLYGGYFPDWICGGQWNKMEQFLRNFASVVQSSNLDLVICFNGALEPERLDEWKEKQEETFKFIEEIHRHVTYKKKPPPKIWWLPPAYLRSAIRSTFRSLQIKTMSTLSDHHKEIIQFCQTNSFHGVVADDPEYLIFDIPRYFSAQKLKLTFKGSLETVEMKLQKVYDFLEMPREKFHIFAALFGNHLLSVNDLNCLYTALNVDSSAKTSLIDKLSEFVKTLESSEIDKVVEAIAKLTSGSEPEKSKELCQKVDKCLRYYSDLSSPTKVEAIVQREKKNKGNNKPSKKEKGEQKVQKSTSPCATESSETIANDYNATGALPSDTQKLETSKIFADTESEVPNPRESEAPNSPDSEVPNPPEAEVPIPLKSEVPVPLESVVSIPPMVNGNGGGDANNDVNAKSSLDRLLYRVNPEIENVCTTRHKNGLMSPYIYHILKHKEIKLSVIVQESKESKELIKAHELFRPLRQRVYAILFNLHHLHFLSKQRNEKPPPIHVKETYYCPHTKSIKSDMVQAVEVGWGVPTVERLWLGDKEECKKKRTRAFLAIMKSDKPVILDSTFVPQQMLVLACVLRYILSTEKKVFRKSDLEALIAQAFIQEMTDPSIAQDIEVANLTMRGVHLAHLFMEGVEMTVLTNDACGAPIPYMLFSPWMFFNGKVFNYVLEMQSQGKSLAEICGYKMDLVFSIDQLRLAVTEGVKVQYAQGPNLSPYLFPNNGPLINHVLPQLARTTPYTPYISTQISSHGGHSNLSQLAAAAAAANSRNRILGPGPQSQNPFVLTNGSGSGRGLYGNYSGTIGGGGIQSRGVPIYRLDDIPGRQEQRRGVPTSRDSGHLQIAGTVVGSWGANYGTNLGLANSLMNGSRNTRIPMGPGAAAGAYANQSHIQLNSLFDQMRISHGHNLGGKVPNFRPGAQNAGWNQNQTQRRSNMTGKNQKKPAYKKPDVNINTKSGNSSTNAKDEGTKPNNAKGVSFKEPQRLETTAVSNSTDKLSDSNKDNLEANESSPNI